MCVSARVSTRYAYEVTVEGDGDVLKKSSDSCNAADQRYEAYADFTVISSGEHFDPLRDGYHAAFDQPWSEDFCGRGIDCYAVLAVPPTASEAYIRFVWRRLSLVWHTDKGSAIKHGNYFSTGCVIPS